ncbi:MAG: AsmA family protein [Candidatus Zixiibacteriota bacterium]
MNWKRLIAGTLIFVAVALIVALIAVKTLISPATITQAIIPKISALLDREVRFGRAELSIFPIGVSIADLEIINKEPFADRALAKIDQLSANLQYLPLLFGRIKVKEVAIHGWEMFLIKDSVGTVNYDFFSARAMLPDRKQQFQEPLCRKFRLDDGRLLLRNDSTGFRMMLGNVTLNYELRGERLTDIDGTLEIDSLFVWAKAGNFLLSPNAFESDWRGYYSQAKDSLAFRRCNWRLDKLSGRLDGSIGAITIAPSVDLRLLSERTELADCADSRVVAAVPFLRNLNLTGQLRIDIAYSGIAGVPTSRNLRGKVTLTDFTGILPDKNVDLRMKLLEANFNERTLSLFTEAGFIGNSPAAFRFTIDDYSDPTYSGEVNLTSDAATLGRILNAAPSLTLGGQVEANISGFIKPSQAEQGRVFGSLRITQASLVDSSENWAIDTLNTEVQFSGNHAQILQLSLGIGANKLQASGAITDFPLLAAPRDQARKRPRLDFNITGERFDFDTLALIGIPGVPGADTGSVMRVIDRIVDCDAAGQILLTSGRFAGVDWENLESRFSITNRIVYSDTISLRALGGQVSGEIVYDLNQLLEPDFEIDLHTRRISVLQLLNRYTSLGESLSGDADLQANIRGRGLTAEQIRPTLTIKGQAIIASAGVASFDFSRGFEDFFGIQAFQKQRVENLVCNFLYADQTLRFNQFNFDSDALEYSVEGTVTQAGETDLLISRRLSKEDYQVLLSLPEFRDLTGGRQPKWATFRALGQHSAPSFHVVSVRQKD